MKNKHHHPEAKCDSDKKESPKKRLILDAALMLFCEKGYDTTSTDEIAQTAGVSKATVYAHFKSKEALLRAVVRDRTSTYASKLLPPPNRPLDVSKALRRIAERQASVLMTKDDCNLQHLIETQAPRFPEIGQIFWEAGAAKVLAEVTSILRTATVEGQLKVPDPELAAVQFLSLVRGDVPILQKLVPGMPVEDRLRAQIEGALRLFLGAYKNNNNIE